MGRMGANDSGGEILGIGEVMGDLSRAGRKP